ncbi:MAG: hypothetical protein ABI852_06510 [Gemmatimonadaceae bacterium]
MAINTSSSDMKANMTPSTSTGMLTGTFRDRDSAERGYNTLLERGYTQKDINVMMSNETRDKHFKPTEHDTKLGNKSAEGGATGAAIGGVTGVILGVLAAAGTLAIPGLGVVLAGPVVAGLAGLGAGGAAGGLIGALVGAGIPEERAKIYETDLRNGGIVLGTKARSAEDAAYIEKAWRENHGENIYA